MPHDTILVNRAPVLTLWAAVVAERLGHPHDTALTLGRALAGLNAQAKGRRLGIYEERTPTGERAAQRGRHAEPRVESVPLMGRAIPVAHTPAGVRAVHEGKPENPAGVERYLRQKFGASLAAVEDAMRALAHSVPPGQLERTAFSLYEEFRPEIPEGTRGWGARGALDLDAIRSLARRG